ncbi:MAG: NTP transferase domain-containing protein [Candidatus Aminicenantes bacterium]|nr:NTP transferase domain-containing protein [Candidatus Aminicenantes bacterium]
MRSNEFCDFLWEINAIILAAGVGTRLKPHTNKIPKALVKVDGAPIIERQIEYFLEIGVPEIVIVTGYLSE